MYIYGRLGGHFRKRGQVICLFSLLFKDTLYETLGADLLRYPFIIGAAIKLLYFCDDSDRYPPKQSTEKSTNPSPLLEKTFLQRENKCHPIQ
jgi:hypothetical protein